MKCLIVAACLFLIGCGAVPETVAKGGALTAGEWIFENIIETVQAKRAPVAAIRQGCAGLLIDIMMTATDEDWAIAKERTKVRCGEVVEVHETWVEPFWKRSDDDEEENGSPDS